MLSHNDVFKTLILQDGSVVVSFTVKHSLDSIEPVRDAVLQRIADSKKPAASLDKVLGQIAMHVEHAGSAIAKLFEIYNGMVSTTPRQRTSAAFKARKDMLESMTPKVLKEFAKAYIDDADEYIMPDDADILRTRVLDAMSEAAQAVSVSAK